MEHSVDCLTVEEVLVLYARLIQRTGGEGGVRDLGLLESAVARPRATFDGEELYADVWAKAAALMESLMKNHPFLDGNKRTAVTATALFLAINGQRLTATSEELLDFVRRVVSGRMDVAAMAAWLEEHASTS